MSAENDAPSGAPQSTQFLGTAFRILDRHPAERQPPQTGGAPMPLFQRYFDRQPDDPKLRPLSIEQFYPRTGSYKIPGAEGRPFVILAINLMPTLGDFMRMNMFAASVKLNFDNAKLIVLYRNDRPYKTHCVSMTTEIDQAILIEGPNTIPVDFFDVAAFPALAPEDPTWRANGLHLADFVIIPSMINQTAIHSQANIAIARIPENMKGPCREKLIAAGLDPERWFAVLHHREGNYQYRFPTIRDVEPLPYASAAQFIIDQLGGQVVRIGHPGMTPFPARPGFVDLSTMGDDFPLQAFAVSHARFLLVGASGPPFLGAAFGIPTAMVDCVDVDAPWGPYGHGLLMKHLRHPNGQLVDQQAAMDLGFYGEDNLYGLVRSGFSLVQNSARELCTMAMHFFETTQGCDGWRPPVERIENPRPNRVIWPPITSIDAPIFQVRSP